MIRQRLRLLDGSGGIFINIYRYCPFHLLYNCLAVWRSSSLCVGLSLAFLSFLTVLATGLKILTDTQRVSRCRHALGVLNRLTRDKI